MKRLILFIALISLCLVPLYFLFTSNYAIHIVSHSIVNPYNKVITDNLINEFRQGDEVTQKDAEEEIIKICLNDLGYENWLNYLDYIDLQLYYSNVDSSEEDEVIIALNLSKDLGVICIYKNDEENYSFYSSIENLLPIQDIKFIKIPNKNYNMIVVYQIIDERLGAFYYDNFLEIYMFKGNRFEKLLKESIYSEEIYRTKWLDENLSEDKWIKNIRENRIDFINDSKLIINVIGTSKKFSAPGSSDIPDDSKFKLDEEKSYNYKYYWKNGFETFSLNDDIFSFQGKDVIIIGDSDLILQTVFHRINLNNNKYKVMTSSGGIFYINKNDIIEKK